MFPKLLKAPLFFISFGCFTALFTAACTKDSDVVSDSDSNDQTETRDDNDESEEIENSILIFSKTVGFRHESIEKGVEAFKALGAQNDFLVDQTEIATDFTTENLSKYRLVVFLNTSGDVLNDTQQIIFEGYIQAGGSFMGVHSATDTEQEWPWYGQLVGAYFDSHPEVATAEIDVIDSNHLSTVNLSNDWIRTDEWYNFKEVNENIITLLNLDETTYSGGTMGENHPIAWYHEFDGGRSFYTGGGHTEASYDEPDFQNHLLGGILYCLDR